MTAKFKCEIELSDSHLMQCGRCMALFLACPTPCREHSPSWKGRPTTPQLPVSCHLSQSGKVWGEVGEGGMVHVFKNGEMMLKHKNKFFSFPETLFIYYYFKFLKIFGWWNWQMPWCPEIPMSRVAAAAKNPEFHSPEVTDTWSSVLGTHQGSWGWEGSRPVPPEQAICELPGTPAQPLSLFAFICVEEKGACQLRSLMLWLFFFLMFCFVFVL